MKKIIEDLVNDHKLIVSLLDVIDKIDNSKNYEKDYFEKIIYVIKNFADKFHHGKEEEILYPYVVEHKGFSKENGPVAIMFIEHDEGRGYVKKASDELKNNFANYSVIIENLKSYSELLRGHIYKEDNILYPMIDSVITDVENVQLFLLYQIVIKNNKEIIDNSIKHLKEL
ncbi:MAG: hypothetical protein COS14_13680 [Bacteroidetes bacterium CG02_land_8_20_14_3_00_31_25]|nr:hypothetical protein [Bacteroidota bacterium]PIV57651.1 MAG: hypothetical protein COS14_13680 [Bacteroidetes bacterium CG02_land_8_20_14_3_00_31_25]PIX32826.1 MAG: hypothetical protein COZ59_11945 [Bacteroidetes bacterium CG_4_8_14_3_um_filter_31_14]